MAIKVIHVGKGRTHPDARHPALLLLSLAVEPAVAFEAPDAHDRKTEERNGVFERLWAERMVERMGGEAERMGGEGS